MPLPTLEAIRFMTSLASGGKSGRGKRPAPEPTRSTVVVPGPEGEFGPQMADLYLPAGPIRAGILLVPGVARKGKDDPRMVAFAQTVARHGFVVVVPDFVSLRHMAVRPNYAQQVVDLYQYLLATPEWAPGGRAGIGGMSFAMGPGMLAALDPAIRDQVKYLFCIGGYFDLFGAIHYATTGKHRAPGEHWQELKPDPYGRWVMAASISEELADPTARDQIRAMVDRRVDGGQAPIEDLVEQLEDPAGKRLIALVLNNEPSRVADLLDGLTPDVAAKMMAMNVASADLSSLKARLILVHGYKDNLIPYTQSLALHRAAPAGQSSLYLVHGLGHVTLENPGPRDIWRMASAVADFLRERK